MCLAVLAIQMLEWKDVLSSVVEALGDSAAGILNFLEVLPEEINEGRKINLSVRFRPRPCPRPCSTNDNTSLGCVQSSSVVRHACDAEPSSRVSISLMS